MEQFRWRIEQPKIIPADIVFEKITIKYYVETLSTIDQVLKPMGRIAILIGDHGYQDRTGEYRVKIIQEPTVQLKTVPLLLDRRDHPLIGMLVGHTLMFQGVISIKRNPDNFTPTAGIFRMYNTEILNKLIINLGFNKPS